MCSAPRASFGSLYKLSLDRHIQVVIGNENWDKKPRSSSALSIRNVTHGLNLYANVFESNAAETGSGLFIHGFRNTQCTLITLLRFLNNIHSESDSYR